jgi:peptide/nickel transport system substrate-binding protein
MIMTIVLAEALPMAELLQANLREIGIDLRLTVLEAGLFFETLDAGEYDIAFGRNIIASAFGEILLDQAHRRERANQIVLTTWISEEMDALIDKSAASFDREERYEINRQIQWIFEEVVLFAPMHFPEAADATGAHVRGFVMHTTPWSQRWDRVYIVERR